MRSAAADALAECKRERGTQFAPEAVDALDRLWALGALDAADVRAAGRLTSGAPKRSKAANETCPASSSAAATRHVITLAT